MAMALVAAGSHGFDTRCLDHQTKDSVMEHGPLVAVPSRKLTALGVGIAIGLALH
jgi:hypothetical protein